MQKMSAIFFKLRTFFCNGIEKISFIANFAAKLHLYILKEYDMMSTVALYPSQSAPVSKKGLKIL